MDATTRFGGGGGGGIPGGPLARVDALSTCLSCLSESRGAFKSTAGPVVTGGGGGGGGGGCALGSDTEVLVVPATEVGVVPPNPPDHHIHATSSLCASKNTCS